jgi:hypothetical protein
VIQAYEISAICSDLHNMSSPDGPAGQPPVEHDEPTYWALTGVYRMGALLFAAISAARIDPAVRPIAAHFERAINPMGAALVWKARADIQWLSELDDQPPVLALWSRNWFARAGLTIPTRRERVLFATWWKRFSDILQRMVLSHKPRCLSATALASSVGNEVPRDCDLELARHEISCLWRQIAEEAKSTGGHSFVDPSVPRAWQAFAETPTFASADALCSVSPPMQRYFVACAPFGQLYTIDRMQRRFKFGDTASEPKEAD